MTTSTRPRSPTPRLSPIPSSPPIRRPRWRTPPSPSSRLTRSSPFRPDALLGELHEKLRTFTEDDCLLLVGNPVLIGMAVAIAVDYTDGDVRVLQWSGKSGEYLPINIRNLFSL